MRYRCLRVEDGDCAGRGRGVPGLIPCGQGRGVVAWRRVGVAARGAGRTRAVAEVPAVADDSEVVGRTATIERYHGPLIDRRRRTPVRGRRHDVKGGRVHVPADRSRVEEGGKDVTRRIDGDAGIVLVVVEGVVVHLHVRGPCGSVHGRRRVNVVTRRSPGAVVRPRELDLAGVRRNARVDLGREPSVVVDLHLRRERCAPARQPSLEDVRRAVLVAIVGPSDVDGARGVNCDRRRALVDVAGVAVHIRVQRPRGTEVKGSRVVDFRAPARVPPDHIHIPIRGHGNCGRTLLGAAGVIVQTHARVEAQPAIR